MTEVLYFFQTLPASKPHSQNFKMDNTNTVSNTVSKDSVEMFVGNTNSNCKDKTIAKPNLITFNNYNYEYPTNARDRYPTNGAKFYVPQAKSQEEYESSRPGTKAPPVF